MSRPEHLNAPEDFYNEQEAAKYAVSTRMLNVQREITARALELLNLPQNESHMLLDIGCGSGLSGEVLTKHGHTWIGLDVSAAMLDEAKKSQRSKQKSAGSRAGAAGDDDDDDDDDDDADDDDDDDEDEDDLQDDEGEDDDEEDDDDDDDAAMKTEDGKPTSSSSSRIRGTGDFLLNDMGNGLGFRPNTFDGCVSISAVQWLCYSHRADHVPHKRLRAFFTSLYACLRRGARAAIQLYPENPEQMEMITNAAMSAGFTGGVVVDYPNSTKAKKYYLVLFAGAADKQKKQSLPEPRGARYAGNSSSSASRSEIDYERSRNTHQGGKRSRRDNADTSSSRPTKKSKAWIEKKKDVQRKQGKDVRRDSKFTGRKRSGKMW